MPRIKYRTCLCLRHLLLEPKSSFHWHRYNHMISPIQVKQPENMGGYRHNIKTPRTGNERRQTNPNKTVCIIFIGYIHILYKLRSVQNTGTCYPGQSWFVRNLTGVPDKSSRGLGSMSRYSAQILICFIAFIFLFFFSFLCGFGWELCRTASMHSAICHCPL